VRREWGAHAAEVEEDRCEDENLPIAHWETDTVVIFRDPREPARKIARQSILRPGSTGESISLYCYLHQCKICKKPASFPSGPSVQQWLKAGLDLPPGKESKAQHMRMWPAM